MKALKYLAVLPLDFAFIGLAQAAKGDIFYTVPFHKAEVKAASKIYVDYHFSAHSQTLICTTDQTDALTSVEWSYKDTTRKLELPITLKDDSRFEGYYADPEGKLVITNDFGYGVGNGSIFVSCEYRKMN